MAETLVTSIANLRAVASATYSDCRVTGYTNQGDGGGGFYWANAADTTSTDNGGTIIVASDAMRWYLEVPGAISAKQFGATGNNTTDDTTAINNWITYILASGKTGYLPVGTYLISSQLQILLNSVASTGLTIVGDGVARSILNLQSVTASPVFSVLANNGTVAAPTSTNYFKFKGIGIQANVAGIAMQLGMTDFSDAINEPEIDVLVQNFSTSSSAVGVSLNYVLNGDLRLVSDVAGNGHAVVCNQATFNKISGSVSAVQGLGIYITNGYNYGNVFDSIDNENVNICVQIDSANAVNNLFLGGTWSYLVSGINATAGHGNRIIAPNPNPVSPATANGFFGSTTSIDCESQGAFTFSTPALPASGTAIDNSSGRKMQAIIWGGSVSSIDLNGFGIGMGGGTFILNAGDSIAVNYSSAPSWVWFPI